MEEEKQQQQLRFAARLLPHLLILLLLLEVSLARASSSSLDGDLSALLAFRALSDPTQKLASWNRTDPAPCATWLGVYCAKGRVTRLVLEGLSLSGTDALREITRLDQLRVLSLKSNLLSGPIPDLFPLRALKLLFLSHNNLSGPIPPSISSLSRLYRLDISYNNLSGSVPASLNRLSRLLTLLLASNRLSGPISGLALPNLQDLDVSSNMLSGAIPPSLAAFPAAAFAGNPALCGSPLASCRDAVSDPSRPTTNATTSAPVPPAANATATTPVPPVNAIVSSSPSSKPEVAPPGERRQPTQGGMSRVAVVAIVVGDFAVLVIVSGLLFCYFWRKFAGKNPSRLQEGEKIVYSSSPYTSQGGGAGGGGGGFERGRMVFFEDAKKFELDELLRASAEMLGKGGYGTTYKAVLDDGSVVAVKRLRDVQVTGKREFEHHMDALGGLRHPNLVILKAYYQARDEKLLVYDYMPNGSLYSLLHGNRGPGRMPLDWTTRMRIAAGAARGLAFIHHASKAPKLAHGNVKSTNVLIDKTGNARLADFGLALLGPAATARYGGYRAPEAPADGRRPWSSQRADVYAFGLVLLELLTGKPVADGGGGGRGVIDLPRWVQSVVREEWTAEVFDLELMRYKGIEEEMVGMLQIALGCTATASDQRPRIGHVVKMIEEIRGEVSPSLDSFDSVSDSPSASEGATATTAGVGSH